MLRILGRRNSFNVQKVMWLVGELDLPHTHVPAGGSFGLTQTPEFLAMNPHGRVPVIEDAGTVVWESHAVLRYLAAQYGGPAWWPEAAATRSQFDRWMDWSQATLHPAFINEVFWTFYRTPEAQQDAARIARGVARCGELFSLLERWLEGRSYMEGETLSLADITVGTPLYRYFALEIERPALPRLEAYYARLQARPAYATHVMVPFDELKGRQGF